MNTAIICAAGNGTRLRQAIPKALVMIQRKPMFYWPLLTFGTHKDINNILILAPHAHISEFQANIKKLFEAKIRRKIIGIRAGGQERQDSIYKGITYLEHAGLESNSAVLVHNAANVFVSPTEITEVLKSIKAGYAAGIAIPSADTLREVNKKMRPTKKLDRSKIWRMQTPQGATLQVLIEAYRKAMVENFYGTDDIELVERTGHPVRIVPGSILNFKITYPDDLIVAEAIKRLKN